MSTKLSRDAVLREMLSALVKGWGRKAVWETLNEVVESTEETSIHRQNFEPKKSEPRAVQLIEALSISGNRRDLMIQFARDFDDGIAFPKLSDVRAFLASHHQSARRLRSRGQAFRMIIPLLAEMSERGLMKIISRSQRSGPADLGSISDAIKGAGENLRGTSSDDEVGTS